jgi:hypothetical protein
MSCRAVCGWALAWLALLGPSAVLAETQTVQKDLRPKPDASALYVVFCARDAVPGHAFVVFGKDDPVRGLCSVQAWGYYPSTGNKGVLGPVPGELADESIRGKGTAGANYRLVLRVNKEQYEAADAVRRKWAGKGEYKVLERDCVSFATDVARALRLSIPTGVAARHPQVFIRKLAELNK